MEGTGCKAHRRTIVLRLTGMIAIIAAQTIVGARALIHDLAGCAPLDRFPAIQ
jgi:hypothetical protein